LNTPTQPTPQPAGDAAHAEWMRRHGWGIGYDEMQHLALVPNSDSECRGGDTVFTHPNSRDELTRSMANNLIRQYGDFAQGWKAAISHAEPAHAIQAGKGEDDLEIAESALQRAHDKFIERAHVDPGTGYPEFNRKDENFYEELGSVLASLTALINDFPASENSDHD
jgi:hypothetical protein